MLVLILAFGITVVGCDNGSTDNNSKTDISLNGTWVSNFGKTVMHDGSYEWSTIDPSYHDPEVVLEKGTYVLDGNIITFTVTHLFGDGFELEDKLYTKAEVLSALHMTEEQFAEQFSWAFKEDVAILFSNGQKYTILGAGGSATYTRQ